LGIGLKAPLEEQSLQWSRRYSRRIIGYLTTDATVGKAASMEPPLFTADNSPALALPYCMAPGFNGAAVIHGG